MDKTERAILVNALCRLVEVLDLLSKGGDAGKTFMHPLRGIVRELDKFINAEEEETKE